jgi:S1-C subfamily serine protease
VTYDRDEWRRAWQPGETPARGSSDRRGRDAGASTRTEVDSTSTETGFGRPADTEPGRPADAGFAHPERTEPDADGVAEVGQPQGAQGGPAASTAWDASTTADPAAVPLTRFPQPPPEGWDASSHGPGSPVGSVRPPDTTGTVDAPDKRARRGPGILAALLAALLGAAIGTAVTLALVLTDDRTSAVTAPSIEVDGDAASVVPAVAQAVTPSVVRIDVMGVPGASPLGAPGGAPALGSGVIYRSDGYILTNHHVIEGADAVRVRLSSGDILDAEVIGSDPLNDLAVLRVEREGLPAINLRTEDEPLIVGETVIAIGSPFGLDASVTTGIISALNREIAVDEAEEGGRLVIPSVIQTDAAINPGNSGGALVDARGQLVGINTAILTRSGASQGVGFAVSAEQAIASADQLIDEGFVRHPLLGIAGIDVSPEVAEEFGLEASRGAVVDSVQEDTGAAEAGIRPGDIIVGIDGEPLATMSELVAEVRRRAPGDVLTLSIVRNGDELEIDVTLGERPR